MSLPTNVTLQLKGLLVLSAREGQPTGKVGFLKSFPQGHDLTIKITKQPPTGPIPAPIILNRPQIQDALSLNIVSAQPNITVRNWNPVNRLAEPTERDSINWFVDLEKSSELYTFPVGRDIEELKPLLTFNSGQLFASSLSETMLQVQKGIFSNYTNFGRVAVTIGIDFVLTATAVFKNGPNVVFDSQAEPGTDYLIEITHDAQQHPHVVSDANHYYKALGTGIPLDQRILFMSFPEASGPPSGPEAACFPAYLSQTVL